MAKEPAIALRRLLAFAMDWLVVVLWGGVLFGAVMIATGGDPPRPENPWRAQGIGLLTMTIPVILYFALCESSAIRASLGKRVLGLVVSRESGGRLSFGSALARNAAKFTPWEFGHTVAQQAAFAGEGGFPVWVWGPATVAFVGPVWWLVAMIATGRTPYDRWAFAQVRAAAEPRHSAAREGGNMEYFALFYYVVDDFVTRRAVHREEHLRLAREAHRRGELLLAGALADPTDRALLVFRAAKRSAVEEFARNDPYVTSGLVTQWEVRSWAVVIGNDTSDAGPKVV